MNIGNEIKQKRPAIAGLFVYCIDTFY